MEYLLQVKNLKTHFPIHQGLFLKRVGTVFAVDGVSLHLEPHETLGLVGESGCGKSTLARTMIRLYRPTEGSIFFDGQDVTFQKSKGLEFLRREMQMVFQDPYGSLNPRHTVSAILLTPLSIHNVATRQKRREIVVELLEKVGLGSWALNRYPHEFSGGQRQRIAIARALTLRPKLIIADEPVSALDVSVQSQILNLLKDLQKEFGMAYLFVAHDLAVVRHMSKRIAVMYLGKIVEMGESSKLYKGPKHPYTQALMASNPVLGAGKTRERIVLKGDVPSSVSPPSGCRFHPRCPFAVQECKEKEPELKNIGTETLYQVACHLVENGERYPRLL